MPVTEAYATVSAGAEAVSVCVYVLPTLIAIIQFLNVRQNQFCALHGSPLPQGCNVQGVWAMERISHTGLEPNLEPTAVC